MKMRIKKIKDNYFENLKMSKYDFLVNAINEIGNFPYIMSGILLNISVEEWSLMVIY